MNAAKTQAITAAQADRAHASLQARRESYLEVVEQAHEMGALYRDIPEILATTPSDARRNAVQEHTKRLRAAYGPFTRAGDFMIVEGGDLAVEALQGVFRDSRRIYMCLLHSENSERALEEYEDAIRSYWNSVKIMVQQMREETRRLRQEGEAPA